MTVIAARVEAREIGSDSGSTWGCLKAGGMTKLFDLGEIVVGFCGVGIVGRFIEEHTITADDEAEIVTDLADYIVEQCKERGLVQEMGGAPFALLAFGEYLWHVDCHGCVSKVHEDYAAVGSGCEVAIGALAVGASVGEAVAAAILHAEGCHGKMEILEVKSD